VTADRPTGPARRRPLLRPLLTCALFVTPSVYCIVGKKDLWPFSSYPMYSRSPALTDLQVFRLEIEQVDGGTHFWKPQSPFLYETRHLDEQLARALGTRSWSNLTYSERGKQLEAEAVPGRSVKSVLGQARTLLEATDDASAIRRFNVVLCRVAKDGDGTYRVERSRVETVDPAEIGWAPH